MFSYTKPIVLFIYLLLAVPTYSQEPGDTVYYFVETGAVVSTNGNSPFWLLSNNFGLITLNSPSVWARSGLSGSLGIKKNLQIIYGADIIDRFSSKNELILKQAYVGVKIGPLKLLAGRYEQRFGNQDPSLSSGGLIWSGNARPIPDISISVSEYTPVPFTKKFVEFKGGISHGWLGDNRTVNNILLHHKYLYVRFGGDLPVKLHYGLHHFAQWGGYSSNPNYGQLPESFSDYLKVFMGRGGSQGAYWTEFKNATGNHIGSHNLGIEVKLRNHEINFYWQTLFEDGSGMTLHNVRDGLWGMKLSFNSFSPVSAILVEYINTTDQSGTFDEYYENGNLKFAGGDDNYFNNGIYNGGWTYLGKTIGTPLITSSEIMSSATDFLLVNNKIKAFHFGFEGNVKLLNYKAFYTYSGNYGTNDNPFPIRKDQHSFLLKSTFSNLLPWDLSMSVAVAADIGELFENNVGIMLSFRKEGLIKLKSKNNK